MTALTRRLTAWADRHAIGLLTALVVGLCLLSIALYVLAVGYVLRHTLT